MRTNERFLVKMINIIERSVVSILELTEIVISMILLSDTSVVNLWKI